MRFSFKKTAAFAMSLALLGTTGISSVFSEEAPADETAAESTSAEETASSDEEEAAPRTDEEAIAEAKLVTKKGNLELYANTSEGTIALKDLTTGKIWWSSPVDLASNSVPAMAKNISATMRLTYGEPANRRETPVTNNERGGCNTKMNIKSDGIEISYNFNKVGITIPVSVTLEDGYMKVYVDTSKIVEEHPSNVDGQIVTKLEILGSFGAGGPEEEGYFVVPDGSGAIINFNNGKGGGNAAIKAYSSRVYGKDITIYDKKKDPVTEKVSLPMYGIVKGDSGLMVVADKGDTCANLNAYVSNMTSGNVYNSAYFDFTLRTSDKYYLGGGEATALTMFERKGILVPEVELRYYPVSNAGGQVDYTDIADKYREYLLKEKNVEDKKLDSNVPLFVDFYGGTLQKASVFGIPVTVKESVTSFATAKYLLEVLNENSVSEIVATYAKYNNDDIAEYVADSFNPSSKLGGKKKWKDLQNYASSNNIALFPSVDNQQFKTGNGYWSMTSSAVRVTSEFARVPIYDLAHGVENKYYTPMSLLSPAAYDKAFSKLFKSYDKNGVTNFAFGSLSNTIYGDYGKKSLSRENTKSVVESIYADAKTRGSVLAENAAAYVLPYADYVSKVPVSSSRFDIFDQDVPLYQMVLHGITPYSSTAVNGDADIGSMVLRALAAGSSLDFDFIGIEASELKDTKLDNLFYAYYANWADDAAKLYELSNLVLGPAADATIDEYNIDGDRIETIYSNGYKTIVDFNENTVMVGSQGQAILTTYKLSDYVGEEVIR